MRIFLSVICILAIQTGCTSNYEKQQLIREQQRLEESKQREIEKQQRIQNTLATIDSYVGRMTFDQAVLWLGQPTTTFSADNIFGVTWKYVSSNTMPIDLSRFITATHISQYALYFDKNTKMMLSGKYSEWTETKIE